jgi:hypothetical protein
MIRLAFYIIIFIFSAPAFSLEWQCRNIDMEIRCDSEKCASSDTFTAFDISISDKGKMEICAYSGCWKGKGKVLSSGKHMLVSGQKLKWQTEIQSKADFMLAIDLTDKVGFIKGEGFAMPIRCTKR